MKTMFDCFLNYTRERPGRHIVMCCVLYPINSDNYGKERKFYVPSCVTPSNVTTTEWLQRDTQPPEPKNKGLEDQSLIASLCTDIFNILPDF